MIENQFHEVKSQNLQQDEDDFKKAFKICQTIFYSEIYKNNKFNAIVYNSIENTVRIIIDKYGIEAILYLESLTIDKYSKHYGMQSFHPSDFLDIVESFASEIQKFKVNLKKKREIKILEQKNSEYDKLKHLSTFSLIPEIFDDNKRAIPNVFLRSALFGVVKKGRRLIVKDQKISSMSQYEIYFSGEHLDQNDLDVWDSLTYIAKKHNVTESLKISLHEICKFMGYAKGQKNREAIKSRIKRLKFGVVEIKFNKVAYGGSLINEYTIDDSDGKTIIKFNKKLLTLFDNSNDFTLINKKIKDEFGENQLASWLFHFYETHQKPIPFSLEYLKELSRSETEQKEFNRMLKSALSIVKKGYENNKLTFNYEIKNTMLKKSKYKY